MDISKKTPIKTTIGFVAILVIVFVGWTFSWSAMSSKVNSSAIHIHALQEDVDALEAGDTLTLVELAKIQTTLKSIEVTLEELKAR